VHPMRRQQRKKFGHLIIPLFSSYCRCIPIRVQKKNPTSFLFGSWFVWAQTMIFSAEPCSKNAGKSTIVLWITDLSRMFEEFYRPAIQIKIVLPIGGIFQQIKVRQPIGRKDSIAVDVLFKAYPMVVPFSHADPIWFLKVFLQTLSCCYSHKQVIMTCLYPQTESGSNISLSSSIDRIENNRFYCILEV